MKRLQKFIADSGYCSRREAELLIKQKQVRVNKKVAEIGMSVNDDDKVTVRGAIIKPNKEPIYIALNKPKGYVSTSSGEKSISSLVRVPERLFIVGRLDKSSHGLILLTNDGDFAYRLTHPSFAHEKEYIIELAKDINSEMVAEFKKGIDLGEKTKSFMKSIKKIGPKKYRVVLSEGRNHQIKRMFEFFGRTVLDLQRVRMGKYKMGNLKKGSWVFINKDSCY